MKKLARRMKTDETGVMRDGLPGAGGRFANGAGQSGARGAGHGTDANPRL